MEIREANKEDNDALLELQKKCPMGVDFVVAIDSSPDYFARSRPYENWHVFVAVENQKIIGSLACTIQNTLIQVKPVKTAYLYGMMVDPAKRRTGIASQLQKHVENYATKQKVNLCHLLVVEENVPSIKLFQKMGFQRIKDCLRFSVMVYKPEKLQDEASIRPMTPADVKDVVAMTNETYHDYDFYNPYTEQTFQEYIQRLPQDSQENILILKKGENIQACLGYWDYGKVIKERVEKLNTRLKAIALPIRFLGLFTKMPKIPKTGEALKQWYLFPMACKDATALTELIKHVNNLALKNNITMLATALDDQSPLVSVLSKFRNVQTKMHFFTKPIRKQKIPLTKERKLYIDIANI
jgi:ribosomal protein S18 acetylase RimI-like enzyme